MGEPLLFRTAGPADTDAVVALVQSAYRGVASRSGWTTEADLLDGQRVDAAMVHAGREAGAEIVLAFRAATLLGCAQLERRGSTALFGLFAVRPGDQGNGVGRAFLTEAERIARDDWKAATMELSVLAPRLELIDWYRRRGYRPTGAVRPFPYGDNRYGLPRRGDLTFVVLERSLATNAGPTGSGSRGGSDVG